MWMGEHRGRKVAVKVLKVYLTSDFNKITSVSHHLRVAESVYRRIDDHRDCADVLQGGCDMEDPSPSECAPAVGSDDGGKALCDGLGMDGQWEYHRVHRGTSGGKSVRACRVSLSHWPHSSLMKSPLTARRRCTGVDVYARRGNDTWGSEGGMNSSANYYSPV